MPRHQGSCEIPQTAGWICTRDFHHNGSCDLVWIGSEPQKPTGIPAAPPAWTANDEAKMQDLQNQLNALNARRFEAVTRLTDVLCDAFGASFASSDAQLRRMIANAGRFRDALAPFDNGVRGTPDV